jgi:hypothetical protein
MSEATEPTEPTEPTRKRPGPKPLNLVKLNAMISKRHMALLNKIMRHNRLNNVSQALRFALDEMVPKH